MPRKVQPKCMDLNFDYVTIEIILIIIVIFVAVGLVYKQSRNLQLKRLERFRNKPIFTMYHTLWCGHSKNMVPIFDTVSVATKYKDIEFKKVDCDKERRKCIVGGVTRLPTLVLEKEGKKTIYNGGPDLEILQNFLDSN